MPTTYAGTFGPDHLQDRHGDGLPGSEVHVYELGTLVHASLYTNRTRGGSITNPLPTGVAVGAPGVDIRGNVTFCADPGNYTLLVNRNGTFKGSWTISIDLDPLEPGSPGNAVLSVNGQTGVVDLSIERQFFDNGATVGAGPTDRIGFDANVVIDGDTLDGTNLTNKVGSQNSVTFQGGFSGEAGFGPPDPASLFGANDYIKTGTTTGDLAGIDDLWGRLIETHNFVPGSSLDRQRSLVVQGFVDEATAHVDSFHSAIIDGPAGAGSATVAYALEVGSPTIGTTKYALYQRGAAQSLFEGVLRAWGGVDLDETELYGLRVNLGASPQAPIAGAHLSIEASSAANVGAVIRGHASQAEDLFRTQQNSGPLGFRVNKDGHPVIMLHTAPADGDLNDGELMIWFDPTNGAAKIKFKGKQTNGTVRVGEVALT